MEEAILFDSVAELGRMLRSREISPLELTAAYIDHAKTLDPQLSRGRHADRGIGRSSKHGRGSGDYEWPLPRTGGRRNPVGVSQDLFATNGIPSAMGIARKRLAVRRLTTKPRWCGSQYDAGALLIAKLATGERCTAYGAKWFREYRRSPGASLGSYESHLQQWFLGDRPDVRPRRPGWLGRSSIGTETEGSIIRLVACERQWGRRTAPDLRAREPIRRNGGRGWTMTSPVPCVATSTIAATRSPAVMGAGPDGGGCSVRNPAGKRGSGKRSGSCARRVRHARGR